MNLNNKHEKRKELSRSLCVLFFKNVDYLRKKRGLSLRSLADAVSEEGFSVNWQALPRYSGRSKTQYFKASSYYMAAFADYFNEPMSRLLSVNYEEEEKVMQGLKG